MWSVRSLLCREIRSFVANRPSFHVTLSGKEKAPGSPSFIVENKDLLRRSHEGLQILDFMDSGAVIPDLSIYSDLIRLCAKSRRLEDARLVHDHFLRSDFPPDVFINNSIINMFSKCGAMQNAQQTFDAMPLRDVVSWTALITGYAQNAMPEKAVALFPNMLSAGLRPNHFTFSILLKASGSIAENDETQQGAQIHGFCVKSGCDASVFVGSAILDMHARCGRMEAARRVFDSLPSKNDVSWNALIAGFARKGEVDDALEIFREMRRSGVEASHYTYSSLFGACSRIGSLEQGKWIHAHLAKSGSKLIAFLGNTLLDMYAKCGAMHDARKLFWRLKNKDVVSWNTILAACAQHGLGKEAVLRMEEMLASKFSPNEITFLCVITACSRSGMINEGDRYFNQMKKRDIEPQIEHYVTMVDLLGRAGLVERAESFIREMPIKPTAAVWGALLGACRMHKNWKLGEYAARQALSLEPRDPGTHMLLYNLYASTGRWDDAASARRTMKELGVKKEPACSWVELKNSVHAFVADDDSHPRKEEIYRTWEEVSEKIKKLGYVPDAGHVLLFMDERERETRLQSHSERIALAFALLSSPAGAPVRIKKNIRVCGDCHSAFKLVSKALNREIIVRDTNRFHHFRLGSCSCGDYW